MSVDRPRTAISILTDLGLFGGGSGLGLTANDMEDFAARRKGFDLIHLGCADLPVEALFAAIRAHAGLLPVRSGHLGNWDTIATGYAGMMDYNQPSAAGDLGYPLVYSFNQTEDANLQSGDSVYLPGSLVRGGARTPLRLFTWNGARFIERGRDRPLLVPLVLTPLDGELMPLSQLLWQKMEQLPGFRFQCEARVIMRHEGLVREILTVLIEAAKAQRNQYRAFQDILSHVVASDGGMSRSPMRLEGRGYRLGEAYFPTTATLVDAAMLPYLAATDPKLFFANIRDMPRYLPRVSNLLSRLLSAFLNTHYPVGVIARASMTQPCNPHLHWGGVGMAGYPPMKGGYFAEASAVRSARRICATILSCFPQLDPVLFLLLPAAMFSLWPPASLVTDQELLAELFAAVKHSTDALSGKADRMWHAVSDLVDAWLARVGGQLSPYFRNRFTARHSVFCQIEPPGRTLPTMPSGFTSLTVRQSSMIVGALIQSLGTQSSTSA